MSINLSVPDRTEFKPRITIVGLGGGGCNAVDNIIATGLEEVDFIVCNTDVQALQRTRAQNRVQLGRKLTEGLGAGADAEVGRAAAEESLDEMMDAIGETHMLFVVAGMGGGTGTGAAPVLAKAARDKGILTVAVVTKPFSFEAVVREETANAGIAALRETADSYIVVSNQNLFKVTQEATSFVDSFKIADEVLSAGVCGVADLIMKPGVVNVDFADVRSILKGMGAALMGTGEGSGEDRVQQAASAAIHNPLLEDIPTDLAKGLLVNITAAAPTLTEVERTIELIRDKTHRRVNLIFGTAIDENLGDRLRVSVMMTGLDDSAGLGRAPEREASDAILSMPLPSKEPRAQEPKPVAPTLVVENGIAAPVQLHGNGEAEPEFAAEVGLAAAGGGLPVFPPSARKSEEAAPARTEPYLRTVPGNGTAEARGPDAAEELPAWPESEGGEGPEVSGGPDHPALDGNGSGPCAKRKEPHVGAPEGAEDSGAPDSVEAQPRPSSEGRQGLFGRLFDFGKEPERREPTLDNVPEFDDEDPEVLAREAAAMEAAAMENGHHAAEEPASLGNGSLRAERPEPGKEPAPPAAHAGNGNGAAPQASAPAMPAPEAPASGNGNGAAHEAPASGNGNGSAPEAHAPGNGAAPAGEGSVPGAAAIAEAGEIPMTVSEHPENPDVFQIPAFLRRG